MSIDRRARFLRRLELRRREAEALDPRLKQLIPLTKSSRWNLVNVVFPDPNQPIGEQFVFLYFHVHSGEEGAWRTWCYRILHAGGSLGVRISQELTLDRQTLNSEWVISFKYNLDRKEDFELRMQEAIQLFVDILKAAL